MRLLWIALACCLAVALAADAWARGGGGGAGAGARGAGGGARASGGRVGGGGYGGRVGVSGGAVGGGYDGRVGSVGGGRVGGGISRPSPGMGGALPPRPAPRPIYTYPSGSFGYNPDARPFNPANPGRYISPSESQARAAAKRAAASGGGAGNRLPGQEDRLPGAGDRGTGQGDRFTGSGERPGQLDADGSRRDQFAQNREQRQAQFRGNQQQQQEQRQQRGDEIRSEFADHQPRWDFWQDHPYWAAWRFSPWRWATWAGIGSWFGYAGEGYAYDYSDDCVYVDGQEYPVDEQYVEQATAIANAGAQAQPDDTEWMPLGVFALVQEEQGQPTMFLQLAISREGVIAGTYYNLVSKKSQNILGSLDRKTQRVAMYTAKQTPVLETGVQNLTLDQAPVLLHFGDGKSQRWLLVRLPEPKNSDPEHSEPEQPSQPTAGQSHAEPNSDG